MGRITVTGGTDAQKTKFYTDLWHALLGRRNTSDVDGAYIDNTGTTPAIRQVTPTADGAVFPHYCFDALWGSHWNLNVLRPLAWPEVMDGFCQTMVDMYRDGGPIPSGPSGGNYTFVMIGDPATSFFAAACHKNIRSCNVENAYEGLRKNAFPGGIRDHAGYEFKANATAGGLSRYLDRGYVPQGVPGVGQHQDGAAMTLEYAYQDWCLGKLARSLGKKADANLFLRRSQNYRHLWNEKDGWMEPRLMDGSWIENFAPSGHGSGRGFTESNSASYTWYVPHDLPGLIALFGGNANFVMRLNEQFVKGETRGFSAHAKYRTTRSITGMNPALSWRSYSILRAHPGFRSNGFGKSSPRPLPIRLLKQGTPGMTRTKGKWVR